MGEENQKVDEIAANQLSALTSVLLARAQLLGAMGKSFGTQRDIFQALGYETNPSFFSYWWRYRRTSLGRRVIQAFPKACWQRFPTVEENQKNEQTTFENEFSEFLDVFGLFRILRRLDILAGIGEYGVLYLGFATNDPKQPLRPGEPFLFMRPFTSDVAVVEELVSDVRDSRYGLPLYYKIQMSKDGIMLKGGGGASGISQVVHYSRVLHVAEDVDDGEVYGTPRLEPCLNDLQTLDYVVGGSGEMFWQGAFPGHAFLTREGVQMPTDTAHKKAMEDEIGNYIHGLKRYMKLSGIDVHDFQPQAISPREHYDVLVSNISAATGIPKRILLGSERGELASTQDRDNWADKVMDRQVNFCEPVILRPLIDKLIFAKVFTEPSEPYSIVWPPIQAPNIVDQSMTAKAVAEAVTTYASGPAEYVMPRSMFLKKYLGFTVEEVEEVEDIVSELPNLPIEGENTNDSDTQDQE